MFPHPERFNHCVSVLFKTTSPVIADKMDFYPQSLLKRHGSPSPPLMKCTAIEAESARTDWIPDSALFEKGVADITSPLEKGIDKLPKGWPTRLTGPLVWNESDLKHEEYEYTLSYAEIQEIEHAWRCVKSNMLFFWMRQ